MAGETLKGRPSNNPNGRGEGSKNARSIQWEQLGESIMSVHTKRFNDILSTCEDDVFMENYLKVLQYFKPKLSNQQIELPKDNPNEIIIRRVEKSGDTTA